MEHKELLQLREEVERLIVQFDQVADWVEEIEYEGGLVNVREFFQRVISRYERAREQVLQRQEVHKRDIPEADLAGLRVLTVEDNPDIRTLLTLILEASGADVTCVASAPRALELLGEEKFDAIVSDIGMPEMSGLEFIRRLRAGGSHIPGIALSAYSTAEDRHAALDAGYDLFVAKPVQPAKLIAGLSDLIAGEQAVGADGKA
jgi:CheY-like chemotaxis protein